MTGENIKFILDRTKKEQEDLIAKIFEVVKKKPYPDERTKHLARFVHALFQTAPYIKQVQVKKEEVKEKPKVEKKEAVEVQLKPLPPAPKVHRINIEEPVKNSFKAEEPTPPVLSPPSISTEDLTPPTLTPQELTPPNLQDQDLTPPSLDAPELTPPSLDNLEPPTSTIEKPKKREYVVMLFNTPVGIYVAPDENTYKLTYHVIEPVINEAVLKLVKNMIKKDFKKNYKILDNDEFIKENVMKACKKLNVQFTEDYPRKIKYYLKRDLAGFRRIDPMLQDTNVKGIYIDGVNKPVVVEFGDTKEKIQSNVVFTDPEDLNVLIRKLAILTGNTINESNPILNTTFEGIKIQAVLGLGGASSKLIIKKVML
ncbi:hypothetical protein D6777_03265 [Candidatus Woesearchaeota archaeon]|nr:MAG: hypothetical protein D6777_03265 [Candidatus Woesearchaeota archaeon]